MKRIDVGRSVFIYTLVCCLIVMCLCWLLRGWLYTIQEHHVFVDAAASSLVEQQIVAVAQQQSWYNPVLLAAQIQKELPAVQSVTVANRPIHQLEVDVTLQQPLYCINTNFVITDKHIVVPAAWYASDVLTKLPELKLSGVGQHAEPELDYSLLFALAHLPQSLWGMYHIAWINAFDAYLYDITEQQFAIRFNAHAIPNDKLLATCAALKEEIFGDKKFFLKKRTRHSVLDNLIVADIRFANQIIVYEHKGGLRNG